MELFLLYIWLKLGSISTFLITICVLLAGVAIWSAMNISEYHEKYIGKGYVKQMTDRRNKFTMYSLITLALVGGLPSKTDVAILVGANYALKAAETPEAQKVMTILRAKANEILDAEIKEQVK